MKEKKLHIGNDHGFTKIETGYSAPEGYFESFEERLFRRMEAEEVKHNQKQIFRTRGVLFYLRPALGIAASLAILITVFLHPYSSQNRNLQANIQESASLVVDDKTDPLSSTYASLISDSQFLLALTEMDDYDASKISKAELVDYLASNCSDLEILNANK